MYFHLCVETEEQRPRLVDKTEDNNCSNPGVNDNDDNEWKMLSHQTQTEPHI